MMQYARARGTIAQHRCSKADDVAGADPNADNDRSKKNKWNAEYDDIDDNWKMLHKQARNIHLVLPS